jgi:outer membrane lipoprotein-sorting protein
VGFCYSPGMLSRRGLACVVLLGFSVTAAPVSAYVPSADFLLKLLADKRRELGLKDLSAQLVAEVEGVEGQVDEHLYMKAPERVRLVSQREDGPIVYVEREGQRAAGPENALKRLTGATDLTGELFMPAGTELEAIAVHLISTLKALGVDTSIVSLGRQEDTLAYIIGARPFEPDKPQVWIYKQSLQPMRTVLFEHGRSSRVEVRYLDFGSPVGGDYLPGAIEVYRDGKRVRRAELQKLAANQGLPDTLFDVPRR